MFLLVVLKKAGVAASASLWSSVLHEVTVTGSSESVRERGAVTGHDGAIHQRSALSCLPALFHYHCFTSESHLGFLCSRNYLKGMLSCFEYHFHSQCKRLPFCGYNPLGDGWLLAAAAPTWCTAGGRDIPTVEVL